MLPTDTNVKKSDTGYTYGPKKQISLENLNTIEIVSILTT
jgi:hypothetical protein